MKQKLHHHNEPLVGMTRRPGPKRAARQLLLLLVVTLLSCSQASATHFRFGMVTATRLSETPTTVTYQLNLSLSWRLGTAPASVPFVISGGNSGTVTFAMLNVTDPSGLWQNGTSTQTVTLNKSATPTKIEFSGFTKLATTSNNASTNWDVYVVLATNAPGSTPVSSLPAIINVPAGDPATTFTIPAQDPEAGSTLTFGYPDLVAGPLAGETEPSGFSVNSSSGLVTFNTVSKNPGEQYNALVTITDNDGNQIILDFLINIVSASAPPSFDYSVTPADGSVYNIIVGQNLSFPIKATNPGSGTTVGLSASGLNSYLTTGAFSPAMPNNGNPSITTFSYTPTGNELGTSNVLNFIATNNSSIQTATSVVINVVAEPAPNYVSNTPVAGSLRSILAGAPHSDTITVQSSLGSNVSITYANVPSGAVLTPAVPTPAANPGQTILVWTPTSADFGQHALSFQSVISSTPTIVTTLGYDVIVNDIPVFLSTPVTSATACGTYTYSVAATDANLLYGDTLGIVPYAPLPSWLTLTPTGVGTATLSGVPTNADAGSYTIVLSAEDMYHHNYAAVLQTFTITVTANQITGTPDVCMGATTTLADALTGGAWNTNDAGIATVNSSGVVSGIAPGAAVISYTTGGGCATTATVNVFALPTVSAISGAGSICLGNTSEYTDATTGGTWVSSNTGVVAVNSSGTAAAMSVGSATLTYTYTNGNGCTNSATKSISVLPLYTINASAGANGSISPAGASSVCSGDNQVYTISPSAGYHVQDITVDGSSAGNSNSYTFSAVGADHTISVSFAPDCTIPVITSTTAAGVCGTGSVTLVAVADHGTLNWYAANSGGASLHTGGSFTSTVSTNTTYYVEGSDASCVSARTAVVASVYPVPTASAAVTNVSCNGGNNGAVSVTGADGTSPYNVTGDAVSGLIAGNYNYTVTDGHGCTATASATVSQPSSALSASSSVTNVSCNGGANGSVTVSATGGTTPYTGTGNFTGKSADTYNYTVTDANGCTAGTSAVVSQPAAALSASSSVTNVSCNGGSNGAVTVSAAGGTTPYTGTGNFTGKSANTYSYTVTDANGCTAGTSAVVSQPSSALSASSSVTNVSCNGGANGTVTVSAAGGTTPYTGTGNFTGKSANTYNYTVTDANGCTAGTSAVVSQPAAALSASSSVTNVSCNGGSNGSVVVSATGGTTPYTGTGTFNNKSAGNYSYTVTDANGCTASTSATVNQPEALSVTGSVTNISCASQNTGGITTAVTGGTQAYSYSWNTGATTSGISSQPAGNYTVTVTDANNCTASANFSISQSDVSSTITGSSSVLGGTTATYNGPAGMATYNWSVSGGDHVCDSKCHHYSGHTCGSGCDHYGHSCTSACHHHGNHSCSNQHYGDHHCSGYCHHHNSHVCSATCDHWGRSCWSGCHHHSGHRCGHDHCGPTGISGSATGASVNIQTPCCGGAYTITLTTTSSGGCSSTTTMNVTVTPSSTITVYSTLYTTGSGNHPSLQKTALAATLKVFDRHTVGRRDANQSHYSSVWNGTTGLVPEAVVSDPQSVNIGGGPAYRYILTVPAGGRYLVIGQSVVSSNKCGGTTCTLYTGSKVGTHDDIDFDDHDDEDDDDNSCSNVALRFHSVLKDNNGKCREGYTQQQHGSLMLMVSPAALEFSDSVELLPVVYESVEGEWGVSVTAEPPYGFYAEPSDALSTTVTDSLMSAVQFNIIDTGSEWTFTKLTHAIQHKGENRVAYAHPQMVNLRTNKPTAVEISPNPAYDQVHIVLPNFEGKATLSVYDLLGREVASKPINIIGGVSVSMDVSSLPPGVYLVTAHNASGKATGRMVKTGN